MSQWIPPVQLMFVNENEEKKEIARSNVVA
jgi:hypothetical protein